MVRRRQLPLRWATIVLILCFVWVVGSAGQQQRRPLKGVESLQANWGTLMRRVKGRLPSNGAFMRAAKTLHRKLNHEDHDAMLIRKGISAEEWWLQSSNLAQALGLEPLEKVEIPVDVNLLFAGFDGDDGGGVVISEESLRPWMEHVHSRLRHQVAMTGAQRGARTESECEYVFRFHVHTISSEADKVIFSAIQNNMRPSTGMTERLLGTHQVDSGAVAEVLEALASHLNLTRAYTLFVLNPPVERFPSHKYGYRYGLSREELASSANQKAAQTYMRGWSATMLNNDADLADMDAAVEEALYRTFQPDAGNDKDDTASGETKVSYKNVEAESAAWATSYALPSSSHDSRTVLHHMLERDSDSVQYVNHVANYYAAPFDADCLTDMYMTSSRVSWIDVEAGPFTWGPVVGGQGVKSNTSLPRVSDVRLLQDTIVAATKNRANGPDGPSQAAELDAETITSERNLLKEVLERSCYGFDSPDPDLCRDLETRIATLDTYLETLGSSTASGGIRRPGSGGAPPPPPGATGGLISESAAAAVDDSDETAFATDTFLSSFGAFLDQTIHHVVAPHSAPLRPQMPEKVAFNVYIVSNHNLFEPDDPAHFHFAAYRQELQRLALPGQEFSFKLHKVLLEDDPHVAMAYYSSLRSAVVPTLKLDGSLETSKRLYIDSFGLVQQLERAVQGKGIKSHYHKDDESTAGKDGSSVRSRLRRRHGGAGNNGNGALGADGAGGGSAHFEAGTLQVPVFLFSLLEDLPVFVDTFFQARAVHDMVVAVQTPTARWESHMMCNHEHVRWDLRNPLGAMLQASAQVATGLLPAHLYHNSAHGRSGQNWLWSVGRTPLAHTSMGAHFSRAQVDIARRNQVMGVLDETLRQMSAGFKYLVSERPTKSNMNVLEFLPVSSLHESLVRAKLLIDLSSQALARLDFSTAAKHAKEASQQAFEFHDLCLTVVGTVEMTRCDSVARPQVSSVRQMYVLMPVLTLIGIVVHFGLRVRGVGKPKIN